MSSLHRLRAHTKYATKYDTIRFELMYYFTLLYSCSVDRSEMLHTKKMPYHRVPLRDGDNVWLPVKIVLFRIQLDAVQAQCGCVHMYNSPYVVVFQGTWLVKKQSTTYVVAFCWRFGRVLETVSTVIPIISNYRHKPDQELPPSASTGYIWLSRCCYENRFRFIYSRFRVNIGQANS